MVNGRNGDYDFIRVHRGRKKLEKKGREKKIGEGENRNWEKNIWKNRRIKEEEKGKGGDKDAGRRKKKTGRLRNRTRISAAAPTG